MPREDCPGRCRSLARWPSLQRWGLRAVIVEDDQQLQVILSAALSTAGFEVLVCGTGDEGLATVEWRRPDLVIVDGMLPGMDGIEVCRRLRQLRRSEQLPIIFISAEYRTVEAYRVLTEDIGVDLILHKPLSPQTLVAHALRLAADVLRDTAVWRSISDDDDSTAPPVRAGAATAEEPESGRAARPQLSGKPLRELPVLLRESQDVTRTPPGTVGRLRVRLHQIKGSAGTYGFPDIPTPWVRSRRSSCRACKPKTKPLWNEPTMR
jgi:CheY-like chemotaxis protein